MKYSEAKVGRVFVLRLEDGEILHEEIEAFAKEQGVQSASVLAVGGADASSKLIVGPEEDRSDVVVPVDTTLQRMHEVAGVGTIFPDDEGTPCLHMHVAAGCIDGTTTGCIRRGVKTWHILEVIIQEFTNCAAQRVMNDALGFKLLEP